MVVLCIIICQSPSHPRQQSITTQLCVLELHSLREPNEASQEWIINSKLFNFQCVHQVQRIEKEGLSLQNSLKNIVFLNTVNENEDKSEEDSSLKSGSQFTNPVPLQEMNLPIPGTIRTSSEFQFPQKSFSSPCNTSCSGEDPRSRKNTSPTWQEEEEYFQAFQPNPPVLRKQLSCQELDFLSF